MTDSFENTRAYAYFGVKAAADTSMRILIIGGGIGGFTAAIALRRAGIDAQVYEAAPALREVGAGLGLASNALWTLDALGLGEEIRSNSQPGCKAGSRGWDGRVLAPTSGGIGEVAVMHRAELLALLARNLESERLHVGWRCVGFEQNSSGVTAHFRNGETAQGDCLIGADGIGSVVRSQLLIGRQPKYSGYTTVALSGLRAAGAATLVLLAGFIFFSVRRESKHTGPTA